MIYLFVHLGGYPYWLKDSIQSVKINDPESTIVLCGDSAEKIDDIINLHIDNIASPNTLLAMQSALWKNDPNPLWKTSLYRIFILLDMMDYLKINEFVHFDSDVILFKSFDQIKESINLEQKGLHITPCNSYEVVFGYSYCNSKQKLDNISKLILKSMTDYDFLKKIIVNHPNEMQILSGIQKLDNSLIIDLPTLPSVDKKYIFDPSSYGQYLYGTHAGDPKGWHGTHHRIGKLISEKGLEVFMDTIPYAMLPNGIKSYISNLHIHSKNTKEILNNGRYRL